MSASPKLKVLLAIVLIFLAGGVAGALIGTRMGKEAVAERSNIENLSRNVMSMLEVELSLTPAQVEVIEPLVWEACEELKAIHRDGAERVEKVIRKYHEIIATELTDDQLPILKEMERERREKAGYTD